MSTRKKQTRRKKKINRRVRNNQRISIVHKDPFHQMSEVPLPVRDIKILQSGLGFVMKRPYPDYCCVRLLYQDDSFTRNNAGNNILSWRYKMNSAYDPDPSLGTGALSGFTEWAAFFSAYRVLQFSWDIQVSSREAVPVFVTTAPTLTDVGANYASAFDLSEFPYGQKTELSTSGGMDRSRIRGSLCLTDFNGSRNYLYNDQYAGLTSGNPTTVNYFNIGVISPAVLVNGVVLSVRLVYDVFFFRHQVIIS